MLSPCGSGDSHGLWIWRPGHWVRSTVTRGASQAGVQKRTGTWREGLMRMAFVIYSRGPSPALCIRITQEDGWKCGFLGPTPDVVSFCRSRRTFFFFFLLGPRLQHMEVCHRHNHNSAGSKLHLWPLPQLVATPNRILNQLSKARDQTLILRDTMSVS